LGNLEVAVVLSLAPSHFIDVIDVEDFLYPIPRIDALEVPIFVFSRDEEVIGLHERILLRISRTVPGQ
jgi:hypothetical protein